MVRLAHWLDNVDDDSDKRVLFEFALRLTYFSQDDFFQLYQSAFCGPITRWIIRLENLNLGSGNFQQRVADELLYHTWYCPVTDSMAISEFYHANQIDGIVHRPTFKPLRTFGSVDRIRDHMANYTREGEKCPLKRLVLLEDFVGSGSQISGIVKWAAKELNTKVLFVPLIICPNGAARLRQLEEELPDVLTFQTVCELDSSEIFGPNRAGEDTVLIRAVEDLANRLFVRVSGGRAESDDSAPYRAFGYRNTGAAIVNFSNTPNNTLPLVHHRSSQWSPLFPRVSRS
jgi:hypothetical protein